MNGDIADEAGKFVHVHLPRLDMDKTSEYRSAVIMLLTLIVKLLIYRR